MRHSLLTEDRIERVEAALRQGATRRAAANAAGLGAWTLHYWMREARRDIELGRESKHVDFLRRVERAEAEAEVMAVATLRNVGAGGIIKVPVLDELRRPVRNEDGSIRLEQVYQEPQWKALAWLLERRFPREWGRKPELSMEFNQQRQASQADIDWADDNKVIKLFEEAVKLLD
jgi:transposase-like protein